MSRAIEGGRKGGQAVCRNCGAAILWTRTRRGKRMPVDPEPVSVTRTVATAEPLVFTLSEEDHKDGPLATLTLQPRGYLAHWTTCSAPKPPRQEARQ